MAEKPPFYRLPTTEEFAQFAKDYFALMDRGNPLTAEDRRRALQDPQERDISPATAALRNKMTPNTVGYIKTMRSVFNGGYASGTSERIKDIGDKVAEFLKKPQGTLTETESLALLDEISGLGSAGEPLTGMEYINRLSLFMSVGNRAVAEQAISAADYMDRKEFLAVAMGGMAASDGVMRNPAIRPSVGNTLPRTRSGHSGVVILQRNGKEIIKSRATSFEGKKNAYNVKSEKELDNLFDELLKGKSPKKIEMESYNGEMFSLSDGTRVGLRQSSQTGGKTIDYWSGRTNTKVHIEP